jgi:hypothetical protein
MQNEFLIRQRDFGLIVNEKGMAKYEPLDWRQLDVTGLAYSFPYILAMSSDKISMYSMLDKQKKQTIQFQGGKVIGDYNEKVYVASEKQVFMLSPISFEKQVQHGSIFIYQNILDFIPCVVVLYSIGSKSLQSETDT